MKKTYPDECLERASNATPAPWEAMGGPLFDYTRVRQELSHLNICLCREGSHQSNGLFIAAARTDVVELARRLKRACYILRRVGQVSNDIHCLEMADEFEAPPEEK